MTCEMSTRIEPRKKALRFTRKPSRKVLLALMLELGAAGHCDAQATQGDAPPADLAVNADAPPAATAPRASTHWTPHHTPAQVIDANVHRLAQGLKLDQEQQAKLREILVDQYALLMKLRTESASGTDRVEAMRAIMDRTRGKIRALLNDEQKKQYGSDAPHEVTAATRADLEYWLDVRDAQRKEHTEGSK